MMELVRGQRVKVLSAGPASLFFLVTPDVGANTISISDIQSIVLTHHLLCIKVMLTTLFSVDAVTKVSLTHFAAFSVVR